METRDLPNEAQAAVLKLTKAQLRAVCMLPHRFTYWSSEIAPITIRRLADRGILERQSGGFNMAVHIFTPLCMMVRAVLIGRERGE